jgi:hypothetical protein
MPQQITPVVIPVSRSKPNIMTKIMTTIRIFAGINKCSLISNLARGFAS